MMKLVRTDSSNDDFRKLIAELDNDLNGRYGNAQLDYDGYNKIENIGTIVVAYDGDDAVGCGCFKPFDDSAVEVKRMFVKKSSRGKKIASAILNELEIWAVDEGYVKAVLETGAGQPEAIGLYAKRFYEKIPNYGQYKDMPNSICMQKDLQS